MPLCNRDAKIHKVTERDVQRESVKGDAEKARREREYIQEHKRDGGRDFQKHQLWMRGRLLLNLWLICQEVVETWTQVQMSVIDPGAENKPVAKGISISLVLFLSHEGITEILDVLQK